MTAVLNNLFRRPNGSRRLAATCLIASSAFLCVGICVAQDTGTFATPRLSVSVPSRVHAFSVSPSGDLMAAGGVVESGFGHVTVWDTATGEIVSQMAEIPVAVFGIGLSSQDDLAVGLADGTVLIVSARGGDERSWQASGGAILACAFHPDGTRLATAGSGRVVRIWDADSGDLITELHGHTRSVWSLRYEPVAAALASGGADGRVMLWNPADPEPVSRWQLHQDSVSDVAFGPSGQTLASAGWDGNILLMDALSGAVTVLAQIEQLVFSVDISSDGSTLAAGLAQQDGEPTLQFWHLPSRRLLLTLGGVSNRGVRFLAGGTSFAAVTTDGEARIWDISPRRPTPTTPDGAKALSVRWEPAASLYYEIQFGTSLPLRAQDRVFVTRATAIDVPDVPESGDLLWWRVRSRGFAGASEWTESRSVFPTADVANSPRVWVSTEPAELVIGDQATIRLMIEGAADLAGFEAALTIEPALIEVLNVVEGDALGADGVATFWKLPTSHRVGGSLTLSDIASARLGAGGIEASGSLVEIRVRANGVGTVDIRVENLRLSDSQQRLLAPDVTKGALSILAERLLADVNLDGRVNILDLVFVAQVFGRPTPAPPADRADVNRDGVVDILDLLLIARDYSRTAVSASPALSVSSVRLDAEAIRHLRAVKTTLDGMPTLADSGGARLTRILNAWLAESDAVPLMRLGRNYPNPSNPETWFPFELAREAVVSLTIHDLVGRVVRRIDLGSRPQGEHVDRGSAVHWDGRTGTGEVAASGMYIAHVTGIPLDGGARQTASLRFTVSR